MFVYNEVKDFPGENDSDDTLKVFLDKVDRALDNPLCVIYKGKVLLLLYSLCCSKVGNF